MKSNLTERVHEQLRVTLARKNLKQTDLAHRLGWSDNMLSKRIRGLTPISTNDLDAMAEALEVPVEELIGSGRS